MAHPAETAPKAPAAFGSARLTPEEADRLASTIRPSWELDDAPFTGPGSLSPDDLRALQGGGTLPAVRAAAHEVPSRSHASNGSYPPPPTTLSKEPESSVILDDSLAAEIAPPVHPSVPMARPGATIMGMPASQLPVVPDDAPSTAQATSPLRPLQRPLTPQRPVAPAFQFSPPGAFRAKRAALDLDEPYPRKSKTTLWVALGLGGVAVVGLVAWIASSSGSSDSAPAAAATTTATNDKASTVAPPPAIPAAAAVPPAVEPPAPPPPTPAPPPMAPVPVAALPQVAPAPTHVAAAPAPRANYGGPNQVLRPPGKPKNGQTIVRDVPF